MATLQSALFDLGISMPALPVSDKPWYGPGETSEWYTPAEYVEAARTVMGSIDLDPASCEVANKTVRAATYFDRSQDGLRQHWYGNVWLNPPYSKDEDEPGGGQGKAAKWAAKLLAEYRAGRVNQAVMLVGVNTINQRAMQELLRAAVVCFKEGGRIRFISGKGKDNTRPSQCNMFYYLGARRQAFREHFDAIGACKG